MAMLPNESVLTETSNTPTYLRAAAAIPVPAANPITEANRPVVSLRTVAVRLPEAVFQPLELETRAYITTEVAAFYLNRKPQTLRVWACLENGPIRPIRINGRLAWPVQEIQRLLSGGAS